MSTAVKSSYSCIQRFPGIDYGSREVCVGLVALQLFAHLGEVQLGSRNGPLYTMISNNPKL